MDVDGAVEARENAHHLEIRAEWDVDAGEILERERRERERRERERGRERDTSLT